MTSCLIHVYASAYLPPLAPSFASILGVSLYRSAFSCPWHASNCKPVAIWHISSTSSMFVLYDMTNTKGGGRVLSLLVWMRLMNTYVCCMNQQTASNNHSSTVMSDTLLPQGSLDVWTYDICAHIHHTAVYRCIGHYHYEFHAHTTKESIILVPANGHGGHAPSVVPIVMRICVWCNYMCNRVQ